MHTKSAKKHLRQSLERRAKNRATKSAIKTQIRKVRAAVAGKLTAFTIEVGQSLAPGTRIGQIDDPSRYKVTAEIDEYYLNRVDIGQTATVLSDGRTYELAIAKIYPQVRDGRFTRVHEITRLISGG